MAQTILKWQLWLMLSSKSYTWVRKRNTLARAEILIAVSQILIFFFYWNCHNFLRSTLRTSLKLKWAWSSRCCGLSFVSIRVWVCTGKGISSSNGTWCPVRVSPCTSVQKLHNKTKNKYFYLDLEGSSKALLPFLASVRNLSKPKGSSSSFSNCTGPSRRWVRSVPANSLSGWNLITEDRRNTLTQRQF